MAEDNPAGDLAPLWGYRGHGARIVRINPVYEAMLKLLLRLEWSGPRINHFPSRDSLSCPVCREYEVHSADCELKCLIDVLEKHSQERVA